MANAWAESSIVVSLKGARETNEDEVALATSVVLAEVFQCPQRDVEIREVVASSSNESLDGETSFYDSMQAMQVTFRIKISNSQVLSLNQIEAAMANYRRFAPKVVATYLEHSSLKDFHIMVVEVQPPILEGEEPKVEVMDFNDYVALVATIGVSLSCYFCIIGVVGPAIFWCLFVNRRPHRLQGHLQYISPHDKSGWVVGLCDWYKSSKATCCSLVCFLPARLAYTWDTVGILPYWRGVRQALMCCGLYLVGCWPCGAFIAGQRRSDLKEFLGFGDGVKSNIEIEDVCYYILCPLCSVVQEAAHVDRVFSAVARRVKAEAEKAKKRLEEIGVEEDDDEEMQAEAPTLQAMFDEGFNAALDTAVGALD